MEATLQIVCSCYATIINAFTTFYSSHFLKLICILHTVAHLLFVTVSCWKCFLYYNAQWNALHRSFLHICQIFSGILQGWNQWNSTFLMLSSVVGNTVTVIGNTVTVIPDYNVPPQHNIGHIVCDDINTAIRDSPHGCWYSPSATNFCQNN